MNNVKSSTLAVIILFSSLFIACSSDDSIPIPVHEEEVITTLRVTLSPGNFGNAITLETRDLDGDGPNAPVVTVSDNLAAMTTYSGTIVLLNETITPSGNITLEVQEEADEHQFFYTTDENLDLTTSYTSFDDNSNPLGITFDLTTGAVSTGTLTITLRHDPTKPNTGLTDAGGETDISSTFNVTIQ